MTDPNLIAVATRLGVAPADLFDLDCARRGTGITETFLNLTTKEAARRADRALLAESNLVRVTTTMPSNSSPTARAGRRRMPTSDFHHEIHAREECGSGRHCRRERRARCGGLQRKPNR
ncbi:MAG: hypothetical protein IPO99_19525 [Nitrospira sp.]|nr:hypothetical protein [Nitrospira sp.]